MAIRRARDRQRNPVGNAEDMCIQTAMVGSPKAMFTTTAAVFFPTPGKASSARA